MKVGLDPGPAEGLASGSVSPICLKMKKPPKNSPPRTLS